MAIDNFRDAIRDISTHVGRGANIVYDSTFTVYIVDVIDDPKRVSDTRKETILKFLHKKEAFDYLPGKSIIFAKVNKYGKMRGNKVFYALPFMSPHFSQPINAGELAWVFNDNGAYYWISRKTSLSNLEDINYTSGLRTISEEDTTSERSGYEIANKIENTDETVEPDFPSILNVNILISTDPDDESLKDLMTFSKSHSSKSFFGEPSPIVKPSGNEFLLQGGNNSSIKLGNNNYYNTGNIELTAGITTNTYATSRTNDRGYEETSRAVIEDQNESEGVSDYYRDASRIFISAGDDAVNRFVYGSTGPEESVTSEEDDPLAFTSNVDSTHIPTIAAKTTDYFVITNPEGGIFLRNNGGSHVSIYSSQINIISNRIILAGTDNTLEHATRAETLENLLYELSEIIEFLIIPTAAGPVTLTNAVTTPGTKVGESYTTVQSLGNLPMVLDRWRSKLSLIISTSVELD
jgi:hypothetical protein